MDLSFYTSYLSEEIRDEGREQGREQGLEQGRAQGSADAVLVVLEQRGLSITDAVRERVKHCDDPDTLQRWLKRAVTAATAEEVFADEGV
ncbi:hypothetical protein ACIRQY_14730 [Streptomyces sp. NPDC101490]|uniref:hypothetical protein n=1 Tax=Streptomyces sp. NPDC101490 TaxID=3366143 RepID=UPI00382A4973